MARSAYAEARRLLGERETAGRLSATYVDPLDIGAATAALTGADVLWLDALSNPGLDVPELDVLVAAANEAGAVVVVDATLATPILIRPLALGADLVLHSATKYIGGHSDLLLGVVSAREPARAARLRDARAMLGAGPGAIEAWLGLRGLRTLPLRLERGQDTARLLATRLSEHPGIESVRFPGLADDPAHANARRLLDGYGSVLSFVPNGGAARANAICELVKLITHATSLGGVETLIERPARWHPGDELPAGLLRLSAGCEDPEDLWSDLERALAAS
jgi:cystathionine gamma-synthase